MHREVYPLLFADPEVAKVIDRLIDKNLKEEFQERRRILREELQEERTPDEEFASPHERFGHKQLRQETDYLLKENMKYRLEHWALEEIDQELKTKRKEEPNQK